MSPVNLTSAVVVGVLYTSGTYLLLQRSLMRVLIGMIMLGHGTNLLLLLVGGESGQAPMVGSAEPESMSDPLPQGMALTSIVITFALTTFLLALAYRAWTLLGDDEVRDDLEDSRIRRLERVRVGRGPGSSRPDTQPPDDPAPVDQSPAGQAADGEGSDIPEPDGHDLDGLDPDAPFSLGALALVGILEERDRRAGVAPGKPGGADAGRAGSRARAGRASGAGER